MSSARESPTPFLRGDAQFTTTHWSVVLSARENWSSDANAALEQLCCAYWYPLYAYGRRCGYTLHDAQDLTQAFFTVLLQKHFLDGIRAEYVRSGKAALFEQLKAFLTGDGASCGYAELGP